MILTITLPREGKGCNPNEARRMHRMQQAADAKAARACGYWRAEEAMRAAGVTRGGFRPCAALLVTFWHGRPIDVDNAAACLKAQQDGIFDALGVDDRSLRALLSVKIHDVRREHKEKDLFLFDTEEDFLNVAGAAIRQAREMEPAEKKQQKKKGGAGR